jgi:hypothetical protein
MGSCSIPNSIPATGRISILSLNRSKRSSRRLFGGALPPSSWHIRRSAFGRVGESFIFNVRRLTFNAQRSLGRVGRWRLDVERWTFSYPGRVQGTWWSPRSSKPSSAGNGRDRFDSYPLRSFMCDGRRLLLQAGLGRSTLKHQSSWRGGEGHVSRAHA